LTHGQLLSIYSPAAVSRPPRGSTLSKAEIGARVRWLRTKRGLTQAKLAAALRLTQSNVSAMERGDRGLTIHQAVRLARILHVTVDELLTGGLPPRSTSGQRGYDRKLLLRLAKIEALSKRDRQVLLKSLDMFLKGAGTG